MPGKYSHSVVLADYSSRGIIVLPPDQQTRYAKSAPSKRGPAASTQRLRGTRSAQTMYRPPSTTREGWDLPVPDRPHPSLSTNATPVRARINVLTEEDEGDPRPLRYSGYYDQIPHSTPAVNVASQVDSGSAYERQQFRNGAAASPQQSEDPQAPSQPNPPMPRSAFLTPEEQLIHPAMRNSNSNVSLRKDAIIARQQPFSIADRRESNQTNSSDTLAGHPNPASHEERSTEADRSVQRSNSRETDRRTVASGGANNSTRRTSDNQKSIPEYRNQKRIEPTLRQSSDQARAQSGELGSASSGASRPLKTSQMSSSQPRAEPEPNFDGFSDQDSTPASYFEVPKQVPSHSRDASMNFTLPIQRPDSQSESGSQTRQASVTPTATSYVESARKYRDTSSRTTAASTIDSSRRQQSTSSVSSAGTPNGNTQTALSNKKEATTASPQISYVDQKWGLPEIQEDNGFSPSIFEDREGENHGFRIEDFDMMGSIGQISSGKDVSIDDDAASELSAALPPPISRFKDEEDEFNANMAKLFGEGASQVQPKKSGLGFSRWQSAKPKGFFSKFKSKS